VLPLTFVLIFLQYFPPPACELSLFIRHFFELGPCVCLTRNSLSSSFPFFFSSRCRLVKLARAPSNQTIPLSLLNSPVLEEFRWILIPPLFIPKEDLSTTLSLQHQNPRNFFPLEAPHHPLHSLLARGQLDGFAKLPLSKSKDPKRNFVLETFRFPLGGSFNF